MLNLYGINNIELVSGGCKKGADNFAETIAKTLCIPIKIHHPNKKDLDKDLMKKNSRTKTY